MDSENQIFSKLSLILLIILIVMIGGYILFSDLAGNQEGIAQETQLPDVILGSEEITLP